jgi:hypothetical protein
LATAAVVQGASVVASNDSDPHPVTLENGNMVPDGSGFVAVGSFSLSDTQISASTASQANFNQLVSDFTSFGSSTNFGLAGEGGLFSNSFTAPINGGSALDGQPIYLVGGNGADLASSDQLWVFHSGETFGADGVDPFSVRIELDAELPAGTTLVGTPISDVFLPSVENTFDGTSMVGVIPEPGSLSLVVLGMGVALLRRRR